MANEIGSYVFETMKGMPGLLADAVEVLPSAVGEDYNRYRKIGVRAPDRVITTLSIVADASAGALLREQLAFIQGTSVDIVDAFNAVHPNCMILNVSTRLVPIFHAGENKHAVFGRFIVRAGSTEAE